MNKKKDEKTKGRLFGVLFVLMMADFLTTFIGVGFLGLTEVNIVPKAIISLLGFWGFFLFILLGFLGLVYISNYNYKVTMKIGKHYWTRFLGVQVACVVYITGVSFNLLNIASALK